jgi:hypothetical protein
MTTEMWIIAAVRIASALPVLRWPLAGALIAIFVDLSDLFLRDWIQLGGVNDYQSFDKWLDQAYMITFLIVALRWEPVPRNIAVALYAYRLAGVIAFELTGDREILLFFPNLFEFWFVFVAALKTFGWEEVGARSQEPERAFGGSGSQPARLLESGDVSQSPTGQSPEQQLSLTGSPETTTRHTALDTQHSVRSWPIIGPFVRFAIPFRYSAPQLAVAAGVILAAKLFHEYTLHVGQWFEGFTATEALEAIWRFLTPPY